MEDSNVNRADSGESVKTKKLEMVQKDAEAACSDSPPPETSPLTKVATPKPLRSSPAPTTAASNALPPCRVCGEKASGFHYGVNTCEACKGFFRRSLQRKQQYKCAGSGQCKIGIGKRSNCPLCRYNKCLGVGMSKSAIKTGRYTHEKRTQDILEVKQMEKSSTSHPRSPMSYRFDPIASCLQSPSTAKGSSSSPSTSHKQQQHHLDITKSPQADLSPPTLHKTSNAQSPSETEDKASLPTPPSTSTSPMSKTAFLTSTTIPTSAATYLKSLATIEKSKTFPPETATNETSQLSNTIPFQNPITPAQSSESDFASPELLIEDPEPFEGPESSTPTFHSPSALLDNYGQAEGSADLTMLRDLRPDASPMTLAAPTSLMQTPSPSTTSPSEDRQTPSCSLSPLMLSSSQPPLSPSEFLGTTESPGPLTEPAAMTFKPSTFDTRSSLPSGSRSPLPDVSRSSCSNDERLPSMMSLSTPTQMPPTPPVDVQDYDSIISTLVEAHKKFIMSHTYTPLEKILENQTRYFEEFKAREAMFGSLSPLSQEQYMDFFEKTGIDIDNRQAMIQFVASQIDEKLRRYISFIKVIPGFTDLPIDDQAALVKSARFEFWFIGVYQSFSSELSVISLPIGKSLHMKELGKIWDREFLLESFRLAETFKKLKLTPDEFVLVKCICNTFADRCVLKNHALVEEIQWRLIQCLLYLLNKNHPDEPGVFARIIDRVTELRKLTEYHYRMARNLQIWPALNQNPLFMEMISF